MEDGASQGARSSLVLDWRWPLPQRTVRIVSLDSVSGSVPPVPTRSVGPVHDTPALSHALSRHWLARCLSPRHGWPMESSRRHCQPVGVRALPRWKLFLGNSYARAGILGTSYPRRSRRRCSQDTGRRPKTWSTGQRCWQVGPSRGNSIAPTWLALAVHAEPLVSALARSAA